MAVSLAMIEALEKAYYSGVKEVNYEDRWLKYDNLSAMRQALNDAKRQYNRENGISEVRVYMTSRKGL